MPIVNQGRRSVVGEGWVNSLINKLPFELHIPGGYQYCGPGTKLRKRLARGDTGINPLDAACKEHDIAYDKYTDIPTRHEADYQLEQRAWNRVKSKDASVKEKAAAWFVTNAMKVKRRLGMGCKSVTTKTGKNSNKKRNVKRKSNSRKISFGGGIVRKVRDELRKAGGKPFVSNNTRKATQVALAAARRALRSAGGKKNIRTPRIIPVPKVGGVLPLIPIFAGLSALGSLVGSAAGLYKTISEIKMAKERLAQSSHQNKEISLGKNGNGVYLKPYRSGLGLYLKPKN